MEEIIYKLFGLYGTIKNQHYSANGKDFYQEHIFADRLIDMLDIMETIDTIQEVFYLGRGLDALPWEAICENAHPLRGEDLRKDIVILLDELDTQVTVVIHGETSEGEKNVLANLAQNIQNAVGFLNRYLSVKI
jgi:hypothetical protein